MFAGTFVDYLNYGVGTIGLLYFAAVVYHGYPGNQPMESKSKKMGGRKKKPVFVPAEPYYHNR